MSPGSPLINPWYKRVLVALSVVVLLIGGLSLKAENDASAAACHGATVATNSVVKIVTLLETNTAAPVPTGTPQSVIDIRAHNLVTYKALLATLHTSAPC